MARRRVRLRVIEQPKRFPKSETFKARIVKRSGTEQLAPAASIVGAMHRAKSACEAGHEVTIRGQYTSDGTKHKNHNGRLVALCERGRWTRY